MKVDRLLLDQLTKGGGVMKSKKQPHVRRLGILKNGAKPCDLWSLPKCQAKAKSTGKRCGNIAVKGKRVCYLHGGKSPGAGHGNKNAYKLGNFTAASIASLRFMRKLLRESKELLDGIT